MVWQLSKLPIDHKKQPMNVTKPTTENAISISVNRSAVYISEIADTLTTSQAKIAEALSTVNIFCRLFMYFSFSIAT
jgi:hypothetical protein